MSALIIVLCASNTTLGPNLAGPTLVKVDTTSKTGPHKHHARPVHQIQTLHWISIRGHVHEVGHERNHPSLTGYGMGELTKIKEVGGVVQRTVQWVVACLCEQ